MFIVYFAIEFLRKYKSVPVLLSLMPVARLSWALCVQPCCPHPPESRAAPTPASLMLEIDGDSNTLRSLAQQRGLQFISKVSAYLSLLHYCHRYAWDFHLKKKSVYPGSFTDRKMKVLSPIFIWGYQAFYQIIEVAFQNISYLIKTKIQK